MNTVKRAVKAAVVFAAFVIYALGGVFSGAFGAMAVEWSNEVWAWVLGSLFLAIACWTLASAIVGWKFHCSINVLLPVILVFIAFGLTGAAFSLRVLPELYVLLIGLAFIATTAILVSRSISSKLKK